ncbi:MAG: IS110 family transposase [Rhodobacteraceae bacterium]|nr:IS110 family transposase [Paracoccaceae bacterium]
MLIEMPELATMTGNQAASLAGLAPISRQSGKWPKRARGAARISHQGAPNLQ